MTSKTRRATSTTSAVVTVLVDTDVLIWCLRGNIKARRALDRLKCYAVSSVTVMELLQGARNRRELKAIRAYLSREHVRHIVLDEAVTAKAVSFLEKFSLSHGLMMADALVAATARRAGLSLLTGNRGDYAFIPGLKIRRFTL